MSILAWPPNERPREKLLSKGAAALSDAELLAIFLRTGVAGKSAVDLAREVLSQFGSLRNVFSAAKTDFCGTSGIGAAKYAQLQAVLEISRRHLEERIQRKTIITGTTDVKRYLNACLRDYAHEVFACLFLDTHHRVLAFDELFQGTLNTAPVYTREVVKRALKHNAASVVLAHNHPSGLAAPSEADQAITQELKRALALVDVNVLDHFIVGDGEIVSLLELGLM